MGGKYASSAHRHNYLSGTQTFSPAAEDCPQQYKTGSIYSLPMNPVLM